MLRNIKHTYIIDHSVNHFYRVSCWISCQCFPKARLLDSLFNDNFVFFTTVL